MVRERHPLVQVLLIIGATLLFPLGFLGLLTLSQHVPAEVEARLRVFMGATAGVGLCTCPTGQVSRWAVRAIRVLGVLTLLGALWHVFGPMLPR